MQDVLLPLVTNGHVYLLLVAPEYQLVGAGVLIHHHQWVWLDLPEEQLGGAHRNAATAQLKFVIVVFNGNNVMNCTIYSNGVIFSLGQKSPRAGTPGFRPPEVLLKYPNQTTGSVTLTLPLCHHRLP